MSVPLCILAYKKKDNKMVEHNKTIGLDINTYKLCETITEQQNLDSFFKEEKKFKHFK